MTLHQQPSARREELVDELRVSLREAITALEEAAEAVSHEELETLFSQGATQQRNAYRRLGRVTGRSSRTPENVPPEQTPSFAQLDDAAIAERVARTQARLAMTYAKASAQDELPDTLRAVCLRGEGECRRQVEELVSAAVDLRHGVSSDEESYHAMLAELEKAASAPPVVGEAETWSGRLHDELQRVCERYDLQRQRHTKIRREMAERDPQLSHRHETLAERESVVAQQLHGLSTQAERLAQGGRRHETGQDEPFDEARQLRISILAWCVAARALEGDIQSSYLESHYRDRGTVD